MIGTIIGDIAGSIYEFDNTADYNFPFFAPDAEFTDDSICTLAVADAILNNKSYENAMHTLCRRYPNPMGAYGGSFYQWVMSDNPRPYNSFGNGAAMRVSPVAWLFDSETDVLAQAKASAEITHSHPEGIKGAQAIAIAIFRMRKAAEKDSRIFTDVAGQFYGPDAFSRLPEPGYFDVTCQGCVPLALKIAAEAESFEDAVRRAVVYGGDTDTVGAIVGSLAEARFGIPPEMQAKALQYLPDDLLAIVSQFQSGVNK
ncbi:MAG: ADP-ribosylglycohydrolase family protein [Muribaculaceae bacterium]|nr:ADP-ribosylglycohydrolase family protein [Muribaculaceae bacterium]